jgi:hypothetical protein
MSAFLKRESEGFKAYALRDALIILKHETAMENFNLSVKKIGVTVTLGSMGRNYVYKE